MRKIRNINFLSFQLSPELFEPASKDEREQLVRMRESTTYWKDAHASLPQDKVAMTCLWIIVAITVFAWIGPLVMPYTYDQQIRGHERLAPCLNPFHPFGTDQLGRDLMVRVMIGTRIPCPSASWRVSSFFDRHDVRRDLRIYRRMGRQRDDARGRSALFRA
jgi:oligopeptide transport system permease protein